MFILFVCVQITDSWVVHSEIVEDEDTDEEADEEKEDVTRSPPSQRRDPEPMVLLFFFFSFFSFLFSSWSLIPILFYSHSATLCREGRRFPPTLLPRM